MTCSGSFCSAKAEAESYVDAAKGRAFRSTERSIRTAEQGADRFLPVGPGPLDSPDGFTGLLCQRELEAKLSSPVVRSYDAQTTPNRVCFHALVSCKQVWA